MLPPKERKCHHTGFAKSCRSLVSSEACCKWVHMTGTDPQSGAVVDHWNCVDAFMLKLQIEANKLMYEAGAATESFRNAVVGPRPQNPPSIPPPQHLEPIAIEHKDAAE